MKISGLSRAVLAAMAEPQSWPTITAVSSPSARTTATLSSIWSSIRYASTSTGFDERPYPRTSMATARKPAAAIAGS